MKKNNFVERRMFDEKKKLIEIIMGVTMLFLFFLVIIINNFASYFCGLKELDSIEKIRKFQNSKFSISNIVYDKITDIQEEIVISSERQSGTTIITPYGGGTIPTGTEISYKNYRIYILDTEDANIILCSDKIIKSNNDTIKVTKLYEELNQEIIDEFREYNNNDKENYVFYYSDYNPKGFIIGLIILLGLSMGILIFIRKSKFIKKRTKLGKQIIKIGEYDKIEKEINEQIKNPIYSDNQYILCKDYIIITKCKDIFSNKETELVLIKNIDKIELIPSDKYPDEVFDIVIETESRTYIFQVYNKLEGDKILKYIKEGIIDNEK